MKIRNLILLAFGLLPFLAAAQTATFDRVRVRQGLTIRAEKADSIIRAVTALSNHTSIPTAKAVWDAIAAIVAASKYQTLRDDGSNMTQQPNANFVSTGTVAFTLTNDGGNAETEVAAAVPAGGITTTEILDGTIANADISSSANIANSKLANSGVTAGTYPSTGGVIPLLTINSKGIITAVSESANVDASATNEGRLGVGVGGSNDALLTSNTSGANGVTFSGGTGVTITESINTNGGTITIASAIASVVSLSDSAAFRAYTGAADVVILTDRDRGGKFRKCPTCTADQYMVFTDANNTKWARFDYGDAVKPEYFGATVENFNDTRGWKLALRYAENHPVKVLLPRNYIVKDSILLRKKVVIEGLNIRNQSSTLSGVDFDIPGNASAIYFTPATASSQGLDIRNMYAKDVSTSGDRHFLHYYAEVSDQKFASFATVEDLVVDGFNRYAVYVSDCYINNLRINRFYVKSCGGVVGVEVDGDEVTSQSQGDSWRITDVNMGGTIPPIVGTDTAFVDVRDANVILQNITLQGDLGTGSAKQLLWADWGNVEVTGMYVELYGTGPLSNFGRLGSTENSECAVRMNELNFSLGSLYASKHFTVHGKTTVNASNITFGYGSPESLFRGVGDPKQNICVQGFSKNDRLPRVDAANYKFPMSGQAEFADILLEYPYSDLIWKLGPDSLFGETGVGNMQLVFGSSLSQVIDSEKGKCYKLTSTDNRAAFTLDLALPAYLRGRTITVSMTYKFVTSDSVGGANRWAIQNSLGSEYVSMAQLQLNRWAVATDVFYYPTSTTTTQIIFGDAGAAYDNDNCQLWIKDISIRFGRVLKPEEPPTSGTEKRLIFRKNISGVNAAGFLDGDLVATESGLYLKKSGAFEMIGGATGTVTGTGAGNQLAYWSGTSAITGSSGFTINGSNLRVGAGGSDHVQIMPGTSEISLFNSGVVDARIKANDGAGIETNVGMILGGNSQVAGNLEVTGSISTSGHFLAPGISSGPAGTPTTPAGTMNLWTTGSPYVTFSRTGVANLGAFGVPESSGDFVWTFGNQVLSSGTERMRMTSTGRLGVGASSPGAGFHLRGTGVGSQIFLDNTTATTGKNWYISSMDGGNLVIGNPTAADAITINGTTGATTIGGPLTLNTATGTATTLTGRTSGGVFTGVSIGSGLSFSDGTLSATGGGGSPGGSSTQVQYNNAGAFDGATGLTVDGSENVAITQAVSLSGDISPSNLSGTANDYAPAGFSTASTLLQTNSNNAVVTGIAGGADGRWITWHNTGANNLIFRNENALSTAANRLLLGGGDVTLRAGGTAGFRYDATASRWRLVYITSFSPSTRVHEFTTGVANYQINIPAGAKGALITGVGGGGGGGSGRKGASATVRCGGGGGASGGIYNMFYPLEGSDAAIMYINVGLGGSGGAAVTANSTNGNAGTAGGETDVRLDGVNLTDRIFRAGGGAGGGGGTASNGTGGTATTVTQIACSAGASASGTGGNGSAPTATLNGTPGPGGSGGGITSANAVGTGGSGAAGAQSLQNGGAANGGAAAAIAKNRDSGGGGGGGNANNTANATTGGAGVRGGGGGGGGAATDSVGNSGAGGDGGDGYVKIVFFF